MSVTMRDALVIHANCQGAGLGQLLGLHPAFAGCEVVHVVNYAREELPDSLLSRARYFLYQHLGGAWEDLASSVVRARLSRLARLAHLARLASRASRARLSPGVACVSVPSLYFLGYWPLLHRARDFDYADRLLDELVRRGAGADEATALWLRADMRRFFDVDALLEASIAHERTKETRADFGLMDYILAHWRERQLFHTVNHPAAELYVQLADGVCEALSLPRLSDVVDGQVLSAWRVPTPRFDLPIHPQVCEREGLAFADATTRFDCYGVPTTAAQFAHLYVQCRHAREPDFDALLALRGQKGMQTGSLQGAAVTVS